MSRTTMDYRLLAAVSSFLVVCCVVQGDPCYPTIDGGQAHVDHTVNVAGTCKQGEVGWTQPTGGVFLRFLGLHNGSQVCVHPHWPTYTGDAIVVMSGSIVSLSFQGRETKTCVVSSSHTMSMRIKWNGPFGQRDNNITYSIS